MSQDLFCETDENADVAVLSGDGEVHLLTRVSSTKSKEAKRRRGRTDAAPTVQPAQVNVDAAGEIEWQRSEQASVQVTKSAPGEAETANLLLTAKVSSLEKDDLLVLGGGRAHVITNEVLPTQKKDGAISSEMESVESDALRVAASLSSESEMAAVLPMRLNSSALSSLVVLGATSKAVGVVRPQAAVTFTVNSAASTSDISRTDGECKDASGNCTLTAATDEIFYSTNPGPFAVNFNIPGAGVPVISGPGRMSINKPTTIDGTTQPAGRVEVRDGDFLLTISGGNSTVRGLVISGASRAITIITAGNNVIEGNYFGTNADGSAVAATKNSDSVYVETANNRIGGTTPAARNVISGNRENGVRLQASDDNRPVRVEGNYIGLNRFGTGALGNGGHGVFITGNVSGFHIGGTNTGAGNVIAHNGGDGIASGWISINVPILSNSIHSNAGLGIDRGEDGVTPNSDNPNNSPPNNHPTLTSVTNSNTGTTITGTLRNSTNNRPYTIQFFSNSACDPSGNGEGQIFIGQTTVTTAGGTDAAFNATISPAVPGGSFITAVAVGVLRADLPNFFTSSEFSNCAQLAATPTPTPTPTPLQLFFIAPNRGGDAAAVTRQITGQGFQTGATARLTRAGQPDIVGSNVSIGNNGTTLTATLDLRGKARGAWSVVVTNPDGGTATLADAFTIGEARRANAWIDILGRFTLRAGLTQRFFIAYGNNGQVDTEPTMFRVYIPYGLTIAELPVLPDGSRPAVYQTVTDTILEFYASTIAAESSTYIPIRLTTRPELAHQNVRLLGVAVSSPLLRAATDLQVDPSVNVTSETTEQTDSRVRTVHHVTSASGSYDVVDEVIVTNDTQQRPLSAQVNRGNGTVQYVTGYTIPVGLTSASPSPTPPPPPDGSGLALTTISPRRGAGGFVTVTIYGQNIHPQATAKLTRAGQSDILAADVSVATNRLSALVAFNLTNKALGVWNVVVTNPDGESATLPDGFTIDATFRRVTQTRIIEEGDTAHQRGIDVVNVYRGQAVQRALEAAGRATSPDNFDDAFQPIDLGAEYNAAIQTYLTGEGNDGFGGHSFDLVPRREPEPGTPPSDPLPQVFIEPFETVTITPLIIIPVVFSFDPNDKVGSLGAGAQHYIPGTGAMPYTIFFENKPDATAPAQGVVITDQLDLTKFDLSTFQLGPVAFGKDTIVTPPAGLSQWTTNVDLRPANNLIVRINAGLDPQTGVVTWTFTSLDPVTLQPTDDPLAGFLPPNRTAPEGEGSVLFSISPRESLTTGTEVRNEARIVFDTNAAIDTPVWLNTIDNSAPSSQVTSATRSPRSAGFQVRCSGTDTGAGIASYTVFVSENGAPYRVYLSNTAAGSATFTGRPGSTYSFYTIARDGAGNSEVKTPTAEQTIRVPKGRAFSRTRTP